MKSFLAGFVIVTATMNGASADPVEDFYRGKTLDLHIGYPPGGTYDLYARLVAQFIGNHIPGNPKVLPRTMAGGGSRVVARHLASVAPRDGTVLATGDQAMSIEQAMGDKSLQFDATKFAYIGNPVIANNTTTTWHASGVRTIEDARRREVVIGAIAADPSSQFPKAMNGLVGTKFKIVVGYPSAAAMDMAMEKGEVEGRGSNTWSGWKAIHPDWVRDGKINILVQIGLTKEPDLPNVPLLMDLASNDEDRAVLRTLSAPSAIGRPIFTTPDTPPERVRALRDAFQATMKDPEFLERARAQKLDVNPLSGEEMQKIVADIVAAPKPVTDKLNAIIGGAEHNNR